MKQKLIEAIRTSDQVVMGPRSEGFNSGLKCAIDLINQHIPDDGWVSVEDRLPEPDVEVACLIDSEHPVVGRNSSRFNCITYTGLAISGSVTHWMPLPSPPKQGEK